MDKTLRELRDNNRHDSLGRDLLSLYSLFNVVASTDAIVELRSTCVYTYAGFQCRAR